jgi:hypothetical protein
MAEEAPLPEAQPDDLVQINSQDDAGQGPPVQVTMREAHRYLTVWEEIRENQLAEALSTINELNERIATGRLAHPNTKQARLVPHFEQQRARLRQRVRRLRPSHSYIQRTRAQVIALLRGPPKGRDMPNPDDDERGSG